MDINKFGRNSLVTHTTGLVERIKKMTNEELLKVLDMSEDEQFKWLMDNDIVTSEYVKCSRHLILADLAFRLRDEAVVNYGDLVWHKATLTICGYMRKSSIWFKNYAQPIHWVIASLIAKELSNEDRSKTM